MAASARGASYRQAANGVRRAIATIAVISSLAAASAAHGFDYDSHNPRAEYEAYFAERYGTPGQLLPSAVIEKRCAEDIRHHLAVLHRDGRYVVDYCRRVAHLWKEHATEASLPELERSMKVLRWICLREVDNPWRERTDRNPHHYALWSNLTEIWLDLKLSTIPREEATAWVIGLLIEPAKYHPLSLNVLLLLRNLPPDNNAFYEAVFNYEIRKDCRGILFLIMGLPAYWPSEEQLESMLSHPDEAFRGNAGKILLDRLYDDPRGHRLLEESLRSGERMRFQSGLVLFDSYMSRPISLDTETKLVKMFDDVLGRIVRRLQRGETPWEGGDFLAHLQELIELFIVRAPRPATGIGHGTYGLDDGQPRLVYGRSLRIHCRRLLILAERHRLGRVHDELQRGLAVLEEWLAGHGVED